MSTGIQLIFYWSLFRILQFGKFGKTSLESDQNAFCYRQNVFGNAAYKIISVSKLCLQHTHNCHFRHDALLSNNSTMVSLPAILSLMEKLFRDDTMLPCVVKAEQVIIRGTSMWYWLADYLLLINPFEGTVGRIRTQQPVMHRFIRPSVWSTCEITSRIPVTRLTGIIFDNEGKLSETT